MTTRPARTRLACRRSLLLAILWPLWAAFPVAAATVDLDALPVPAVDNLEVPIQRQLATERAKVDELLAQNPAGGSELADAYGNLCQYYFVYELFEVAEVCFRNASALDPGDFRWHYYLGAIYRALGDSARAQISLEAALTMVPDSVPTLLRLGRLNLDANRLVESKRRYQRALELAPQSAAAHDGLGRIAYQQGDYEVAITHLTRALELQPSASSIHHILGLAYREVGDREQARYHLSQNEYGFVTFRDPLVYGLADRVAGASFHIERANKAMARHNLSEAVEAYEKALSIDPNDPSTHYNLAVVLVRLGKKEQAIEEFQRALELDPEHRDSHFNLGAALAAEGRIAEASSHFSSAYQIDTEDQEAHLEWAITLYQLGQTARAEEELRSILEVDSENSRALVYQGAVFADLGRDQEAGSALDRALQLSDDSEERAQAYLLLGILAERRGDDEDAVAAFQRALGEDPDLAAGRFRLGSALARLGRFTDASREFEAAVAADPADENLRLGLAMTLLLGEDDAAAQSALTEAIEALGASVALEHLLARLLATSLDNTVRDGERAFEMARSVAMRQPSLDTRETVAMALAELGRYEQAAELQRRILDSIDVVNQPGRAATIEERLALYDSGRPCRAPWFD